MVDLLANGSGIPASASRLAHAMHDVLKALDVELCDYRNRIDTADKAVDAFAKRIDATTPGLNDKALAADVEACRPKVTRFNVDIKLADMDEVKMTLQNMQSHLDGARDSQRAAERRVKELENTVKQLRANNAKLREQIAASAEAVDLWNRWSATPPEQAGCRKPDTQICNHTPIRGNDGGTYCNDCGEEL